MERHIFRHIVAHASQCCVPCTLLLHIVLHIVSHAAPFLSTWFSISFHMMPLLLQPNTLCPSTSMIHSYLILLCSPHRFSHQFSHQFSPRFLRCFTYRLSYLFSYLSHRSTCSFPYPTSYLKMCFLIWLHGVRHHTILYSLTCSYISPACYLILSSSHGFSHPFTCPSTSFNIVCHMSFFLHFSRLPTSSHDVVVRNTFSLIPDLLSFTVSTMPPIPSLSHLTSSLL